jgi:hypothetical protein
MLQSPTITFPTLNNVICDLIALMQLMDEFFRDSIFGSTFSKRNDGSHLK